MAADMTQHARLFTVNDPHPLRIYSALAEEIGLEESIILLQLEFLISISKNEQEGKLWTYQSAKELKEKYFPWWCEKTIRRAISKLITNKYIISKQFNKQDWDRRNWYALNEEGLSSLKSITLRVVDMPNREHREGQIVHIEEDIQSLSLKTETTTETTKEKKNINLIADEPPPTKTKPAKPKTPPPADPRCHHPAIEAARKAIRQYPKKEFWDEIIETLGEEFDEELLMECRKEWLYRGYNPQNMAWLLDWYVDGIPERKEKRNGNSRRPLVFLNDSPEVKAKVESEGKLNEANRIRY